MDFLNSIKISIITLNFNNLSGLKKTFSSVLAQNYANFEFIIIDGGSTDGSKEYLQENSSKIDYWVSEPDRGVYHAMNKGLEKATGTYCLFLNSGDYLFDNLVLDKVKKSIISTVAMCYGLISWEDSGLLWNPRRDILYFEMVTSSLIPHQGVFFNTSMLKEIGGYKEEYRVISDWGAMLQLLEKGFATQKLDAVISICEAQGISASLEQRAKSERFHFLLKYAKKTLIIGYLHQLKKYLKKNNCVLISIFV
jgi:glycosyltransferase involved in cell wall biosynthesis